MPTADPSLNTKDYLAAHHVFTTGEFAAALPAGSSPASAKHRLDNAFARGWVDRVTRGVFVSRVGVFADRSPDAFLLASKLGRDAAVSHASALVALGLSHNVMRRVTFSSTSVPSRWTYGASEFVRLAMPRELAEEPLLGRLTLTQHVDRQPVRVTGRERTLVDCLAQPKWSGGLEALLSSVGGVPAWRTDDLLAYLDFVGAPTVVARTAWVLTLDPSRWHPDEGFEQALRDRLGSGPYYLGDRGRPMRFVSRWRLYVPTEAEPEEWLNG